MPLHALNLQDMGTNIKVGFSAKKTLKHDVLYGINYTTGKFIMYNSLQLLIQLLQIKLIHFHLSWFYTLRCKVVYKNINNNKSPLSRPRIKN